MPNTKISVIIPVLNEATTIEQTLQRVQAEDVEIIIVDGGSHDETVAIAQAWGVNAIAAPEVGRAKQMNAGAATARGEILLFLHADTRLPSSYADKVREAFANPKIIAGAFELQIDGTEPLLRWVEWGVKLRSHLLKMPYGDQAIFLKAEVFRAIGGFPSLPIMEDFELMRRLQTQGKIAIVHAPVLTSARRWQKLGVLRTTLLNQIIILGYLFGVPPETLLRWYRGKRY